MHVSLITGTINRPVELRRLLDSLTRQTHHTFELLVVDQSGSEDLTGLLKEYSQRVPLRHVRSAPGLARALNAGLHQATGEIVAFPDDDCWYGHDLLEQITATFAAHLDWDGITTLCADENHVPCGLRWDRRGGRLTRLNVWFRGMSTAIFLRRTAIEKIGPFDEALGLGPGLRLAAHDTDYLLRGIAAGLHIEFLPQLAVGHPQMIAGTGPAAVEKNYQYALGAGRLMRQHRLPLWFWILGLIWPAVRSAVALLRGARAQAQLEWSSCRGRWRGWWNTTAGRPGV